MVVSSTYFLEKALAYILANRWVWQASALLVIVAFCIDALPLSFPAHGALSSALWALWCVGVAAAVLAHDRAQPWKAFLQGVLASLKGAWYLAITALLSALLAYAAFDMPRYVSVEQSFIAVLLVGLLEMVWWVVGLLIQPHLAAGHFSYRLHGALFSSLSRRAIESLLKLVVVIFLAVCIGALVALQLVWSLEYVLLRMLPGFFSGISTPLWVVIAAQRFFGALCYALYAISGTLFYRHCIR